MCKEHVFVLYDLLGGTGDRCGACALYFLQKIRRTDDVTFEVYDYEIVVDIIQEINELHKLFSLNVQHLLNYNLKKTIDHIATKDGVHPEFQQLINEYKFELNKLTVDLLQLQHQFPGVRYRVKQSEPIYEKILYYLGTEHEHGKVPINKSLNDFLGFRIFVE